MILQALIFLVCVTRAWAGAVTSAELSSAISKHIQDVPDFKFLRAEAKKLGVRVYLFGGTAAGYAHYVKWDTQRKKGDTRFQQEKFDYDYTNIYHSSQDLDIVVDGKPEDAAKLQAVLANQFPHFQGSKSDWEVRLLRQDMGDKLALLNNPDFLNQHTDSNSTGMIEISEPPKGEPVVRDLRDWSTKGEPNFLKDVREGKLHYYFSPKHGETKFAQAGRNPEILSVIRYLTKVFQYGMETRPEDMAKIKEIIDRFDPKGPEMLNHYVHEWLLTKVNGRKLIRNAQNMEYAWNTLEELGLRKKLIAIEKNPQTMDSLAWWMSKEPLRTFKLGEGEGETAAEIFKKNNLPMDKEGNPMVSHETKSFVAYESITKSPQGEANVFISRQNTVGEGAGYGYGFYSRAGREGAVGTGLTIRFRLDPNARSGTDFIYIGGDYFLIRNKAALRVIPESLNFGVVNYLKFLLGDDKLEFSDLGILEKLRRRLAIKTARLSPAEKKEAIEIIQAGVTAGKYRVFDEGMRLMPGLSPAEKELILAPLMELAVAGNRQGLHWININIINPGLWEALTPHQYLQLLPQTDAEFSAADKSLFAAIIEKLAGRFSGLNPAEKKQFRELVLQRATPPNYQWLDQAAKIGVDFSPEEYFSLLSRYPYVAKQKGTWNSLAKNMEKILGQVGAEKEAALRELAETEIRKGNLLVTKAWFQLPFAQNHPKLAALAAEHGDKRIHEFLGEKVFAQTYAKEWREPLQALIKTAAPESLLPLVTKAFSQPHSAGWGQELESLAQKKDHAFLPALAEKVFRRPHGKKWIEFTPKFLKNSSQATLKEMASKKLLPTLAKKEWIKQAMSLAEEEVFEAYAWQNFPQFTDQDWFDFATDFCRNNRYPVEAIDLFTQPRVAGWKDLAMEFVEKTDPENLVDFVEKVLARPHAKEWQEIALRALARSENRNMKFSLIDSVLRKPHTENWEGVATAIWRKDEPVLRDNLIRLLESSHMAGWQGLLREMAETGNQYDLRTLAGVVRFHTDQKAWQDLIAQIIERGDPSTHQVLIKHFFGTPAGKDASDLALRLAKKGNTDALFFLIDAFWQVTDGPAWKKVAAEIAKSTEPVVLTKMLQNIFARPFGMEWTDILRTIIERDESQLFAVNLKSQVLEQKWAKGPAYDAFRQAMKLKSAKERAAFLNEKLGPVANAPDRNLAKVGLDCPAKFAEVAP